jgi:aerobic carbon-monoxide dehydrogenase small subunit
VEDEKRTIRFVLNGSEQSITVDPTRRLLDVLRDDLGLTGTKEGCGEGECGACSVLLGGRLVNSCIVPVGSVEGLTVDTIEAVRETPTGQSLVKRFAEEGAVQCGFCIPGMIMAGYALILEKGERSDAEIREGISGNLCRCTGYDRIVAATRAASRDEEVRRG